MPRTERAAAVAAEVARVAGAIGCLPAHVALSWLRHKGVVPLVGARTAEQVRENVWYLDVTLTEEHIADLDRAGAISLGYPHDFLASGMVKQHMYGGRFADIDDHRGLTALLRSPPTGRRDRGA